MTLNGQGDISFFLFLASHAKKKIERSLNKRDCLVTIGKRWAKSDSANDKSLPLTEDQNCIQYRIIKKTSSEICSSLLAYKRTALPAYVTATEGNALPLKNNARYFFYLLIKGDSDFKQYGTKGVGVFKLKMFCVGKREANF